MAPSRQRSTGPRRGSGTPDEGTAATGEVGRAQADGASEPRGRGDQPVSQSAKLPSVRLARRDELAALARFAPLLRAARDLDIWVSAANDPAGTASSAPAEPGRADLPRPAMVAAAATALDLAPREVQAAWRVLSATGELDRAAVGPEKAEPGAVVSREAGRGAVSLGAILADGPTEAVLTVWETALAVVLESEELDGIATALYTAGDPVGMDGLFDAYATAASTQQPRPDRDNRAALSQALESLADLGVVELGTEEGDTSLTVALSPLGTWGMHRRLRAQGWHVPVLGAAATNGAHGLLATLATCDAEDGEAEITAWLQTREATDAAAELIDAAVSGSPGQRGAAFAVLDRIGLAARDQVMAALEQPLARAHAAVWLIEHGEDVRLDPADRTWLLVDLGAGLLEEASPQDVVAELLPDLPAQDQAEIVGGLWQVSHPGVTGLLTALSDHHPDPGVARAARKAAFKARSPAPTAR